MVSPEVRQTRVLLSEDSLNERSALTQFLRDRGYLVYEAGDGRATLDYIQSHEIDVILLDLGMPSSDGFDVLKYLQQHRRGLPVILLSGMPVDEIQHKIHRLPRHELPPLLLKPVDPDQLLQMVELACNGLLPEANEPAGES